MLNGQRNLVDMMKIENQNNHLIKIEVEKKEEGI